MATSAPTNHVVCVHGVCFHHPGFEQCWKAAIARHLANATDYEFTAVRWNPHDDSLEGCVSKADCDAPFPEGWIQVDLKRGLADAVAYVRTPRLPNRFRAEAIDRCERQLMALSREHPGEPIHVIGHSLGSVIAYQALHRLASNVEAATFVTVGGVLNFSIGVVPLLERDIGRGADGTLIRPPCGKWTNIMDSRDFCYQLSEESIFEEVGASPQDVDHTGDIFGGNGQCPALPAIEMGRMLDHKINHDSVCAHLYYFEKTSKGGELIAAALEGTS